MKIAELFTYLGIKGGKESKDQVGQLERGLKSAKGASLEAKAAFLAAFYTAQQLFSKSGAVGVGLSHFSHLMDTTTDTLQRYQYAARQVGVSNEDVIASFRGLAESMTGIITGEGVPGGFARVAELVGLSEGDVLEWQKNPEKLLQRLQQYAQKEQNLGLRNKNLKSFGLSDPMISALSQNAFRDDVMARADIYSGKEVEGLKRSAVAWDNLVTKIEMFFGRLNTKYGVDLANNFGKIIDGFQKLSIVMLDAAKEFKVWEGLKHVVDGITEGTKALVWLIRELSKEDMGSLKGIKPAIDALKDFFAWLTKIANYFLEIAAVTALGQETDPVTAKKKLQKQIRETPQIGQVRDSLNPLENMMDSLSILKGILTGNPINNASGSANIEVNQTLNFNHDGSNSQRTATDVGKATTSALSSPARSWGN